MQMYEKTEYRHSADHLYAICTYPNERTAERNFECRQDTTVNRKIKRKYYEVHILEN